MLIMEQEICISPNKKYIQSTENAKKTNFLLRDKFQNISKYQISLDFAQNLLFSTPSKLIPFHQVSSVPSCVFILDHKHH